VELSGVSTKADGEKKLKVAQKWQYLSIKYKCHNIYGNFRISSCLPPKKISNFFSPDALLCFMKQGVGRQAPGAGRRASGEKNLEKKI